MAEFHKVLLVTEDGRETVALLDAETFTKLAGDDPREAETEGRVEPASHEDTGP